MTPSGAPGTLLGAAAGTTLLVGLLGTIPGGAHLYGVSVTAYRSYDFRLASLLILGMTMVFAGALCLTGVRGLAYGQRRAWDRAMIGTLLLLLATVPIIPLPGQGEMAAFLAFLAAVNLIVLVGAWRLLEVMSGPETTARATSSNESAAVVEWNPDTRVCPSCGKQVAASRQSHCNHCGEPIVVRRSSSSDARPP